MDTRYAMKSAPAHLPRKPIRLTDAIIRALPPGDYRQSDSEIRKLKVKSRQSGVKTFVIDYKLPGQPQRTFQVGPVGIGIVEARKAAAKLVARIALGEDPASERDKARDKPAADTFGAALADYMAKKKAELAPGSYQNLEDYLLTHAEPLHRRRLHEIVKRDVVNTIAALTFTSNRKGDGRATKNQVATAISGLFAWALGEGRVDANPCIGMNKHKLPSRSRVLSMSELGEIIRALPPDSFGAVVEVLAFTGARAAEIAGLRQSELVGDSAVLPPERTKSRREFLIPLSPHVRAIIDRQLALDPDREFIFGRRAPFQDWSNAKNKLDAAITANRGGKPMPHWVIHDLRRSFITHANEASLAEPHVIEAVVGHSFGTSVSRVYNKALYASQKRAALCVWAERLLAAVEKRDSNVVTMQQRA
jgi:integrase